MLYRNYKVLDLVLAIMNLVYVINVGYKFNHLANFQLHDNVEDRQKPEKKLDLGDFRLALFTAVVLPTDPVSEVCGNSPVGMSVVTREIKIDTV